MTDDDKIVPVKKWHKILGTMVAIPLFLAIVLNIYGVVVAAASNMAVDAIHGGNYENAYIFTTMVVFGTDFQFLILGGGLFFALVVSWISVDFCGLSKGDKPTGGKLLNDFFLGLLFPIAGVIVFIPIYAVLGLVAGFNQVQIVLSLGNPPGFFDTVYVYFYTIGAFLMMSYAIYLIGMIPANAVTLLIVSLVTLPYMKKRYLLASQSATSADQTSSLENIISTAEDQDATSTNEDNGGI